MSEPRGPAAPALRDSSSHSEYSEILKPENASQRDSWLKNFSKYTKIGELYSESGAVICEGKSPMAWFLELQVLNPAHPNYNPTGEELGALYMRLSYSYNRASGFYSTFLTAASILKSQIEDEEAAFISSQIAKYKQAKVEEDAPTKNKGRMPGMAALEAQAREYSKALHTQLSLYNATAKFFEVIMANLEYQRRCLKDYSEILSRDPTNHYSGFKG